MMGFRIERNTTVPSSIAVFSVSALSVVLALVVVGFIFLAYGISPFTAFADVFTKTLGNFYGISEILRKSIPLLLCGIGLLLVFRTSFWNIGAEGQLLMGALAATWVALFSGIPGFLMIPMIFICAFIAGAVWGFIPTYLRSRFNIPEVITTLMLNYVALYIVLYLVHGPWKGETMRGFAYTDTFPESAWLPFLGNTRIHWPTLLLGLLLVGVVWLILNRSKLGYELKVISQSPRAGRYAGISYFKTIFWVMFISGGAAGLAGAGEVAGIHHLLRHPDQISLGYGYTAILVAWLARGNPVVTIITSLLMASIFVAGDTIQLSFGLPSQIVNVVTGLILFFLILSEGLLRYRIAWKGKEE
jgi:simple sugar transport system permease protein